MDQNPIDMTCCVVQEHLSATGTVLRKTTHRSALLSLGRNQFRDVVLRIELGKQVFKFLPREIQIYKKFAKEGKATIKLLKQNVQFLLSNCPPHKLMVFLKTLSVKVECMLHKGIVSDRKRLFSEAAPSYKEISPLSVKDVNTMNEIRAKETEKNPDLFTPKSKRQRICHSGKENMQLHGINSKPAAPSKSVNPVTLKNPVSLTPTQKKVIEAVHAGYSIFFTGSAGTGKSYLLKRIIGSLPPEHTFATASTGVAACQIGGTTLHAFAGIGSGSAALKQCIELASRPVIAAQWRKCSHLIIDEISMVDGEFLDKLEAVARVIRKTEKPFGGIQLIFCGDFLQLPPVTKQGETRTFAFQSKAWRRCIQKCIELKEVHRQSHQGFISVLQTIRMGRCPPSVSACLKATSSQSIEREGVMATRLCTHKEDVEQINRMQLDKLQGDKKEFHACDSDEDLTRLIDSHCPVTQKLCLKIGAQVMLTKNLDVQRGLVNGARGVVVGFESAGPGLPVVQFVSGEKMTVSQEKWSFKGVGGIVLWRRQLPLKLAWAISIHKSQGMSLDCVEICLGRVFECGQAYVALSRAKSLQGLRVLDFSGSCVRAEPCVVDFYRKIAATH